VRFRAQDWFAVPFAAVWLGIVIRIFFVGDDSARNTDPSGNFILPFFLLIGVWILFGRFITDMLARSRTEYTLTNRRAIIEGGLFRRSTRSVNLAAAPEIRMKEGGNGRGTIEFSSGSPSGMMFPRGWPGAGQYLPPAFELIENAASVYAMVLDAQHEAQSSR